MVDSASGVQPPRSYDELGIVLLFKPGMRPDKKMLWRIARAEPLLSVINDPVAVALQSFAHSPAADAVQEASDEPFDDVCSDRIEVLREGLSFEISALAPQASAPLPDMAHHFGCEADWSLADCEAVRIVPGAHLSGAHASIPVVMGLLALARDCIDHFADLVAIAWPPAKSVMGVRYFESLASAWLDGGPFPAPGLIAFRETGEGLLESVGLEFWTGQRLLIEPMIARTKGAARRIGHRAVGQLVLTGALHEPQSMVAPDGSRYQLKASDNASTVMLTRI